mmetsp:Transcript_22889/g.33251  ORF Transcript_22889/g.33251 Transcript_22889/m.33251 type:complete len:385 (+) Transcript_22889:128-1282(+)
MTCCHDDDRTSSSRKARQLLMIMSTSSILLFLLFLIHEDTTTTNIKKDSIVSIQRLLRGGRYGGSSSSSHSSYHSSSSSGYHSSSNHYVYHSNTHYHNNNYNHRYSNSTGVNGGYNNNDTTKGGMIVISIIMALSFAAAGLLVLTMLSLIFPALGIGACLSSLCCCCCLSAGATTGQKINDAKYHSYGSVNTHDVDSERFKENVQRAKLEVEASRSMQYSVEVSTTTPYSGEYITSYVDGGVSRIATLTIQFTDLQDNTGYKLSGHGKDVDGTTLIEDGHANYDGTVWWRERTVTGDVGLQVLSRGKFDFNTSKFDGTWFASSGQGGSYLSFQANANVNQAHPTPNAPPADEMVYPYTSSAVIDDIDRLYTGPTAVAEPVYLTK